MIITQLQSAAKDPPTKGEVPWAASEREAMLEGEQRHVEALMSPSGGLIIVGSDGSTSADAAVAWAAAEALRRHARLRVVYVLDLTTYDGGPQDVLPPADVQRDAAWSVLMSTVTNLEDLGVEVEPYLDLGLPATTLLDHARHANLVVVGSRGHGDLEAPFLPSTSLQLAMHAPCPVVVVRWPPADAAPGRSAGRVVVGVDGSELSEAAVAFAFEAADRQRVGLTAVHAWATPLTGEGLPMNEWTSVDEEERELLSERLAGWGEKFPDVDVVQRAVRSDPVVAVVAESTGAELTVVGSHGAGGLRGLRLGSVSHGVLRTAGSPVAVVRVPRPPE